MTLDAPHDEAENDRHDQQYRAGSAHPLHEQRQTLSEQIAKHRYDDRPQNCAGNVVDKEHAPGHLRSAREQRGKDAQSCDKAGHQDRFVAMVLKIIFHVLDPFWGEKEKTADAEQKSPAIVMADSKADVVANDGARGRNQHHQGDSENTSRCEVSGNQKNRLAGNGQSRILEHDTKKDCPIAVGEHVLLDQLQ